MASSNPFGTSLRYIKFYLPQSLSETDFSRGIVRDMPLSSIPPGGLMDAVDFLLDQPGLAQKRGGTTYQSTALGATTTGVNMVAAVEFSTGLKIVGVGADGHLYDATGTSVVDVGTFGITTIDNPRLFPGSPDLLIVPASDGTSGPKKVYISSGSVATADLAGTPPAGKYITVHSGRVVLGNSTANKNRVIFSPVPVENTWDLNSYIDTNHAITGLASVQGVLLVFSAGATERVVGTIPPDVEGSNMSLQPLGSVGCCDARSIAVWGSYVIFASQEGVWASNGAGFDSLTEKPDGSGIAVFWRSLFAQNLANGGTVTGGIFSKNYYFVSFTGNPPNITLVCYLPHKTWWRVTNIHGTMFSPSAVSGDELYMGTSSGFPGNRIVKLSTVFTPGPSNKNDADGTAVTPSLTTRMLGTGLGLKSFGWAHLTYVLTDQSADNPTMSITPFSGIDGGRVFNVPESPLPETTPNHAGPTRRRFSLNKDGQGFWLTLQQNNASSHTSIYVIEYDQSSNAYLDSSEIA